MTEWQPIETAPEDKAFLGYSPVTGIAICKIHRTQANPNERILYRIGIIHIEVSQTLRYWMPLPEPPK